VTRSCGTKLRIIPVILWEGVSSVKGESFDSWRKLGPINPAVNIYLARNVDEIMLLNVAPNKTGSPIDFDSIARIFAKSNLPLSYGGGISKISDVENLLECGVDKIVLGSASYTNDDLIENCVDKYGSQFVVISVDYKQINNDYICFSNNGKNCTNINALEHIKKMMNLGVGELMITNIDHEGHMDGYDLGLLTQIRNLIDIPIIVNGGAGNDLNHFQSAVMAGADAVASSSTFLFTEITPKQVAMYLNENGFNMRTK